jgi:hypothetical protein
LTKGRDDLCPFHQLLGSRSRIINVSWMQKSRGNEMVFNSGTAISTWRSGCDAESRLHFWHVSVILGNKMRKSISTTGFLGPRIPTNSKNLNFGLAGVRWRTQTFPDNCHGTQIFKEGVQHSTRSVQNSRELFAGTTPTALHRPSMMTRSRPAPARDHVCHSHSESRCGNAAAP